MSASFKPAIRPLVQPALHRWQYFWDITRGRWRAFSLRDHWADFLAKRNALKNAPHVVKDEWGIRFVLYPFDRGRIGELLRRKNDRREFLALQQLVHPGAVAFDIGASLGAYTVLLSRLCGPKGCVFSFEPVPDTFWRLRETLALNRCDNVSALQAAVCEHDGQATINLFTDEHSEWNSLGRPSVRVSYDHEISPNTSVGVRCVSLDQFCETHRIDRIDFAKIDVEGFEVSVFQGAERMLRERRIDYLCFEVSSAPLKAAGFTSRSVFEALSQLGYSCYQFDLRSRAFRGPIQDSTLEWANFFASWKSFPDVAQAHTS